MARNKWLILLTILVMVSIIGLVPGCQKSSSNEGTLKVGLLMSASGVFEGLGKNQVDSFNLAVEQINKAGGIAGKQVQVVFYDDNGDSAQAQQLANRLISQDKVSAIFGPNITPNSIVVSPVCAQNKMMNIVTTAQEYIVNKSEYTWAAPLFQTYYQAWMDKFAAETLKAKNLGILYTNVPFGQDSNQFAHDWASKYGVTFVMEDKWGETDFDFTAQVTKVKNTKMDALLLCGSAAQADGLILKQLRNSGVTLPIIGDICYGLPGTDVTATPAAMEGLYTFAWLDYQNPRPAAKTYLDAFQTKYNSSGAPLGILAYDAVYVYKAAVEKAGSTDPTAVSKVMNGLTYAGAAGDRKYSSDNHCGLTESILIGQQYKNGQFVTIK